MLGCVQSEPVLDIVSVSPAPVVSASPTPAVSVVASTTPVPSPSATPQPYVDPFSVMKSHDDSVFLEFEPVVPQGKPVLFRVNSPGPVFVHPIQSWTVYKQVGPDLEHFEKLVVDNAACWPSCANACGPGACAPVSNACQEAATWVWDQKAADLQTASCSFGRVSCLDERVPVEPGLYKIVFIYSLSCPNGAFDASLDVRTFKQIFQIR